MVRSIYRQFTYVTITVLFLLMSGGLLAQIRVNAPSEVRKNSRFSVEYILETGAQSASTVEVVSQPNTNKLKLLYGPSLFTSSEHVDNNGRISSRNVILLTYTFLATETGSASISGLVVSLGGRKLTAPNRTIRILPGGNDDATATASSEGQFSFSAQVSSRTVYEQEPLIVTYQLRGSKAYEPSPGGTAIPTHSDFVSHDAIADRTPLVYERIRGVDYMIATLGAQVLFAQKSGELTLQPASTILKYIDEDRQDGFLREIRQKKLSTQAIQIKVKPLPTEGKPENFSGAVGQFSISQELSEKQWKTNEAVLLRITIRGTGNLRIAKSPAIVLPPSVELYDPIENTEYDYRDGKFHAIRTIEYSLIPRQTGRLHIDPMSFVYFDPAEGRYRTIQTQPINVNVVQGRVISESNGSALRHTSIPEGDRPYGVLPAHRGTPYTPTGLGYLGLHVLCLLIGVGAYRYMVSYRKLRADKVNFGAIQAGRVATKRLRQVRTHMDAQRTDMAYESLLTALWGYIGDKLKMETSELNRANVSQALADRQVVQEQIDRLIKTIDAIEFARFAPAAAGADLPTLYDRTVGIITELELSLRSR